MSDVWVMLVGKVERAERKDRGKAGVGCGLGVAGASGGAGVGGVEGVIREKGGEEKDETEKGTEAGMSEQTVNCGGRLLGVWVEMAVCVWRRRVEEDKRECRLLVADVTGEECLKCVTADVGEEVVVE